MKKPSLSALAAQTRHVGARFPFVVASGCTAGVCAVVAVGNPDSSWWIRILMGSQLGIPVAFALALTGERRPRLRWPLSLAGFVLVLLYALTLPDRMTIATLARFFQFNVAAHLLVAYLPYVGHDEPNGFWQFNKALFLHLLKALVFTGVLIVGIDVAILALDQLFGLAIDEKLYARVALILLFVFHTCYFLGGVPDHLAPLEARRDYPRGLTVFAQYILAPLVALYLGLLLAYLVKVLVTTDWPSGWIGWLVSCVAAAGLFSLVLLHPMIGRPGQRWITTYARAYFVLMLPSIGMLFLALGKRIGQYGVTENRYFMGVLTLWLLGVAVAGAAGRLKRLEVLPATLALIALLTSFGPWGAYATARNSQLGRFERLLRSADLIEDGRIVVTDQEVDIEARREMSAILDYLMEVHGPGSVRGYLSTEQNRELARMSRSDGPRSDPRALSEQVMNYLGTAYADKARGPDRLDYFAERRHDGTAIEIPARSHMVSLRLPADHPPTFTTSDRTLEIGHDGNRITLIELSSNEARRRLLELDLKPMLIELQGRLQSRGEMGLPDSLLTVTADEDSLRVRLLVDAIHWHSDRESPRLQRLSGYLLIEPRVSAPWGD